MDKKVFNPVLDEVIDNLISEYFENKQIHNLTISRFNQVSLFLGVWSIQLGKALETVR